MHLGLFWVEKIGRHWGVCFRAFYVFRMCDGKITLWIQCMKSQLPNKHCKLTQDTGIVHLSTQFEIAQMQICPPNIALSNSHEVDLFRRGPLVFSCYFTCSRLIVVGGISTYIHWSFTLTTTLIALPTVQHEPYWEVYSIIIEYGFARYISAGIFSG